MPINTCQTYVNNLLNGLMWPQQMTNVPALESQITPPDPNVETTITPQAYVWPTRGTEDRNPKKGGSVPRASFQGGPSGLKAQVHNLSIWVVWFQADDDPDADTLFPGMVDYIMETLRVSADPTPIQADPWTGQQSYLIDIGENMTYEITLRAVQDQRMNRYDALITCSINEVFPS